MAKTDSELIHETNNTPSPQEPASPRSLGTCEMLVLSGIGGAAIAVASYPELIKGDVDFFMKADGVIWLGVGLRIFGGGFLGAFWGYLNRPETSPIRAFQLGLIAPAAIASLVYSNDLGVDDKTAAQQSRAPAAVEESAVRPGGLSGSFSLIGTAHAGALGDTLPLDPPTSPQEGFIDRLVKGILGK